MDKNLNATGYDLYETENDLWAFQVKDGPVIVGTFLNVVYRMAFDYGFNPDNVDSAIQEMMKKDHNAIHFGMYRTSIFTFKRDFKNVKDFKKVS